MTAWFISNTMVPISQRTESNELTVLKVYLKCYSLHETINIKTHGQFGRVLLHLHYAHDELWYVNEIVTHVYRCNHRN